MDTLVMNDPIALASNRSVLIVDDEDHITEVIGTVLEDWGYRTDCLNDVAHAIEFLKTKPYDILICDLHMPGIGGRELMEWTRLNAKSVQILLLSGDPAFKDSAEFMKAYGAHFLSKPFTVSELIKAVQGLAA